MSVGGGLELARRFPGCLSLHLIPRGGAGLGGEPLVGGRPVPHGLPRQPGVMLGSCFVTPTWGARGPTACVCARGCVQGGPGSVLGA